MSGDTLLGVLGGLRAFGINVIVESGSELEPTVLGETPRNVAVGRVIDYARALPLCHAVIGNGAAELTAGALAHGLPVVTLPRTPEQLGPLPAGTRRGTDRAARPAAARGRSAARWPTSSPIPGTPARPPRSRPPSPSYPAPPTSSPAWRCRSPPEATPPKAP